MMCIYCNELDGSKLMTRTKLVNGKAETIDICQSCWWLKEINGDTEDGKSLSKQKPIEGSGQIRPA